VPEQGDESLSAHKMIFKKPGQVSGFLRFGALAYTTENLNKSPEDVLLQFLLTLQEEKVSL
jgi:hypothetical protein